MLSLGPWTDLYLRLHGYTLPAQKFVMQTFQASADEDAFVATLRGHDVPPSELSFVYRLIDSATNID